MYACNMTAAAFKWNTDVAVSRRRRLHVTAVSSPTLCCLTLPSCCSLEQCSSSSASSESECSSICSSLCTGLGCCCGISSNSNKRLFGGDGSALSDRDRAAFKNNWQASAHNQHGCARVCCCLDQPKTPAAPLLQLDDIRSKNAATKRKISLNRRPNHQPSALATHSRLSSVAPVFFIQASQADATTSSPTTAKRLYAPPRNWAATKHLLKFGADREQKPNDRDYHPQPFRDSNNTAYRRASSSLKGAVNVRLQRPDGVQLGLGIAGGADRGFAPTVSFLRPGFIAHRCDQLQIGERLTYVNGIPVSSLTHEQVLAVLRNAGSNLHLQVEYDLNSEYFERFTTCGEDTMSSKCTDIVIEKERGSYGVTLRGGAYGPDREKSRPITVTNIRAGGPAHREGRLQVGDRVLCINGVDVFSATLAVAQRLLEESLGSATLTIEYDVVSVSESIRKATGALLVEIDKAPGAYLGLELQIREVLDLEQQYYGRNETTTTAQRPYDNQQSSLSPSHRAILVDSITPASIADRCGALHCGDEIISVDGLAMDYTTLAEARQLLRSASAKCRLEIMPHSHMLINNNSMKKFTWIGDGKKKIKAISEAYSRKSTLNAATVTGVEPSHRYHSTAEMFASPTVIRRHVLPQPQPRAKSHDRALLMSQSTHSSNDVNANICGGRRYISQPSTSTPAAAVQQREGSEPIAAQEKDSQDVIFRRGYAPTRRRAVGEQLMSARRTSGRRISGSVPNIRHDDDAGGGGGQGDGLEPGAQAGTSDRSGSAMNGGNGQFTSSGDATTYHHYNYASEHGAGAVQSVMSSSYSGDMSASNDILNNNANSNSTTGKRRFSSVVSTSLRRQLDGGEFSGKQSTKQNGCHNNSSLHGHMSTVVPSASGCGYGYGYGSGSGSGSAYLSCASPPAMSQQQQVCHRETMEVSLHSYAKGAFGLVLQRQQPTATAAAAAANPGGVGIGGSACCSTPMPLFISYIEKGSSAERCGVLQVGDRVLTINEWYTANGTVEEANHIMRHSSSPLTLTVEFDVIESLLPPNRILNVKLAKRGNNLGIVTKSETDGRKGEPVIISDIRTGSVAQRCGSISVGDRILAIDNIPLESCTVEEAMRLLQRCGDVVKLRIRKAILQDENESSHTVVYSIELNRKGRPMGITIASRGERGDPVIISQLAPRGLAERTGALRVGDRILAVNGESIEGKKVSDAMHLLQQSGDIVTIKISRYIDQNSNHPYSNSYYPLNSSSCGRYRMMGAAAIPQTIHSSTGQVTDSYNEPPDKLGTPIQSIDSAVESLEDSPVQLQQHTSKSSSAQHRFSADDRISNVQLQYLCEDERNNDWSNIRDTAANDHHHNTTADDNRNEISNHKNGWDSGMSSTTDNNYCMMMECCSCQNATTSSSAAAATDDWVKILEALETVGEAEMLKKLEDSIMSGAVPPPCSHLPHSTSGTSNSQLNMRPHALGHAATSSGVTAATAQAAGLISSSGGGLLSPCASILGRQQPPFTPSNTNTILKHPPLTGCATSSTTAQLSSRPLMSGSVGSDRGDSLSVHSGDSLTGCSLSYEIPPSMPPPKPPRYEQQQQQQQQPLAQAASSSAAAAAVGTGAVVSTLLQQPCILNPLSVPSVGVATASETPLFTQSASYAINSPMTSSSRNLLSNRSIKPSTSGLMLHELNAKTDYFKEAATSSVIAAAPSTAAVTCTEKQPKGTTHRVVLHRDPAMGGFGFSVSDGAGDNPGVFINAILPGGPADRSGQIQPLDRILQVNDTSLQFLDCDLAVPLLSVDRIELLLYRDGTLNCIDEVDEAINNTAALNRFNLKDSAV